MIQKALNILWIKTGPLHPLNTGGKLRTYNILHEISRRHRISYMTLADPSQSADWKPKASEYCSEVIEIPWVDPSQSPRTRYAAITCNMLLSRYPFAVEKYASQEMREAILQLANRFDLVVCDFLAPSLNVTEIGAPSILLQHNVESQIWERHYKTATGIKKYLFKIQWKRMLRYESSACRKFDAIVAVSHNDLNMLRKKFHLKNTIGCIPTGVDTDYFQPTAEIPSRPHHLVFTGSMDWLPNEDAVLYFMKEIYPKIKKKIPDVTFTIAGRAPSQCVRFLQDNDFSVTVTGTVQDIRPYLSEAALVIVPLRIGGGTRIKIFEAMAMGVPVLSTAIGAEGLQIKNGHHLILADEPIAFAAAVVDLLQDPIRSRRLKRNALKLVRDHYGPARAGIAFEDICFKILGNQKPIDPRKMQLLRNRSTVTVS